MHMRSADDENAMADRRIPSKLPQYLLTDMQWHRDNQRQCSQYHPSRVKNCKGGTQQACYPGPRGRREGSRQLARPALDPISITLFLSNLINVNRKVA